MKKKNKFTPLLITLLLFWNVLLGLQVLSLQAKTSTTSTNITNEVTNAITSIETDVTQVVANVQNKVVSIITLTRTGETLGSGSGVIYKNENNQVSIITNHHVIDGGASIVVRTYDGEEYDASLIGSDPFSDLAVLTVNASLNIEPFKIGDSSSTSVGEFVIAIGSPMGVEFENSVTFGIISGKDRLVEVDINGDGVGDWDMIVLQTDAAINPGNSGGALVDMAGQLIGINSLKIASSNIEGMGFSIPISDAIPIINQIEQNGKVNYPTIGISGKSVTEILQHQKSYFGISDVEEGVYIEQVVQGGAAMEAGLKAGDVIVSFNDTAVSSFKGFRRQLYFNQPGDTIKIGYIRGGELHEVEVTLQ